MKCNRVWWDRTQHSIPVIISALTKLYNNGNTRCLFPLIALSSILSVAKCKIGLLSARSAASWGAHAEKGASSSKWSWAEDQKPHLSPLVCPPPLPRIPLRSPLSLSSWLFSCAGNVTVLPFSKLMQGSVLLPWTVPLSPLYDHQQDVFVGLPGTERCWLWLHNDAQGGREMPSILLFFREEICCFRDLRAGQNLTSTHKLHPPNCFNIARRLVQNMWPAET